MRQKRIFRRVHACLDNWKLLKEVEKCRLSATDVSLHCDLEKKHLLLS